MSVSNLTTSVFNKIVQRQEEIAQATRQSNQLIRSMQESIQRTNKILKEMEEEV